MQSPSFNLYNAPTERRSQDQTLKDVPHFSLFMNKRNRSRRFRELIPFLKQIPDDIYFTLDISDFVLPMKSINRLREELEMKLGHYVMTYKLKGWHLNNSVEMHLCAHVKPAELTKAQVCLLKKYERRVKSKNISFSVYQKPLKPINVRKSRIFQLYKSL